MAGLVGDTAPPVAAEHVAAAEPQACWHKHQ